MIKISTTLLLCVSLLLLSTTTFTVTAHLSNSAVTSRWSSVCNFANTTAMPSMKLLVDNYAARTEKQAVLERTPTAWSVSLSFDPTSTSSSTSSPSSSDKSTFCIGRMQYRGFVAPFWLTSEVSQSIGTAGVNGGHTLPDIASLNTADLDYFASCTQSSDRIKIDPVRITVNDLKVSGSVTWNFSSSSNITNTAATLAADSGCDFDYTNTDLSQFVRLFAVVNNGNTVQQIVTGASTSTQVTSSKSYEWVATGLDSDCPIYLGVAIDTAACPGLGSVQFFGGPSTISFTLNVETTADPAIIWYIWTPSVACIGVGLDPCLAVEASRVVGNGEGSIYFLREIVEARFHSNLVHCFGGEVVGLCFTVPNFSVSSSHGSTSCLFGVK